MVPTPTALGLTICEQVIVDRHSRNPSPINIFLGMGVERFPSDPQRFSVFATLTDGQGAGTLELVGIRLDTDNKVYHQRFPITFPDRGTLVNISIRVRTVRFPAPAWYEFSLLVDGAPVARRRFRVYQSQQTQTGEGNGEITS
ncbi:MAG: hypothetical protein HYS12_12295 [Planctomycetes bacterium]|nr:hypothetical protein [Planctomycetota bacterium]